MQRCSLSGASFQGSSVLAPSLLPASFVGGQGWRTGDPPTHPPTHTNVCTHV